MRLRMIASSLIVAGLLFGGCASSQPEASQAAAEKVLTEPSAKSKA